LPHNSPTARLERRQTHRRSRHDRIPHPTRSASASASPAGWSIEIGGSSLGICPADGRLGPADVARILDQLTRPLPPIWAEPATLTEWRLVLLAGELRVLGDDDGEPVLSGPLLHLALDEPDAGAACDEAGRVLSLVAKAGPGQALGPRDIQLLAGAADDAGGGYVLLR